MHMYVYIYIYTLLRKVSANRSVSLEVIQEMIGGTQQILRDMCPVLLVLLVRPLRDFQTLHPQTNQFLICFRKLMGASPKVEVS
jgi:hypothetical protein